MAWTDDSWKDSYDDWKLASPDDDGPECDHEDYEIDTLDWECRCICGHHWPASEDQVNAEIEFLANSDVNIERENRRQWWRDLFQPIRNLAHRFYEWRVGRNFEISKSDDDIPF